MNFTVTTADGNETSYTGEWRIKDAGVLEITPEGPGEPIATLSPNFWQQVDSPRQDNRMYGF